MSACGANLLEQRDCWRRRARGLVVVRRAAGQVAAGTRHSAASRHGTTRLMRQASFCHQTRNLGLKLRLRRRCQVVTAAGKPMARSATFARPQRTRMLTHQVAGREGSVQELANVSGRNRSCCLGRAQCKRALLRSLAGSTHSVSSMRSATGAWKKIVPRLRSTCARVQQILGKVTGTQHMNAWHSTSEQPCNQWKRAPHLPNMRVGRAKH